MFRLKEIEDAEGEGGGGLGGIPCNLKFCKLYNVASLRG